MNHIKGFKPEDDEEDEEDRKITQELMPLLLALQADERARTEVNPREVEKLLFCYRLAQKMVQGTEGVTVTHDLKKDKSYAGIDILASDITCLRRQYFLKIAALAHDMEVFPRTDGRVCITFGFCGLKRRPSKH